MKRLLPILMVFGVFLGSAGESWSLSPCPGSYNYKTWTKCEGAYTYADGRVEEGIFENDEFLYAKKTPARVIAMRRNHDRLTKIDIEVLG